MRAFFCACRRFQKSPAGFSSLSLIFLLNVNASVFLKYTPVPVFYIYAYGACAISLSTPTGAPYGYNMKCINKLFACVVKWGTAVWLHWCSTTTTKTLTWWSCIACKLWATQAIRIFYLSNLAIIIGVQNVTIQVFTFQSNSRDDFGLLGVQCAEPPSAFHLGGGKWIISRPTCCLTWPQTLYQR